MLWYQSTPTPHGVCGAVWCTTATHILTIHVTYPLIQTPTRMREWHTEQHDAGGLSTCFGSYGGVCECFELHGPGGKCDHPSGPYPADIWPLKGSKWSQLTRTHHPHSTPRSVLVVVGGGVVCSLGGSGAQKHPGRSSLPPSPCIPRVHVPPMSPHPPCPLLPTHTHTHTHTHQRPTRHHEPSS